ncbi:hypothetical protein [Streptomyces sp. NPDC059224]|uniref:hypothetical protein n=1 Tax=Streptomyces sp. NPDC059224 TaxID=3346775 RepID=UPI0036C86A3A
MVRYEKSRHADKSSHLLLYGGDRLPPILISFAIALRLSRADAATCRILAQVAVSGEEEDPGARQYGRGGDRRTPRPAVAMEETRRQRRVHGRRCQG